VSVKCVERVLSVLEARVNVCRGESLRRLKFSFSVTYTQKEKPLDLSTTNTPRHSWVVRSPTARPISSRVVLVPALRLGFAIRDCDCQYCMVYSIHTGGRKGSLIPSHDRAIVLHQGGQCRWAGGMRGWLIRAQ